MTERKPQGTSFPSWIDKQISDAQDRGAFDNLPGTGKPLDLRPDADGDFGDRWVRDYARREGVRPEEFLPTPLRLRKEIEQLSEEVSAFRSEDEVRAAVEDLNRRILEWRRIPAGPPVFVRLVDADEMVGRLRDAQAARLAASCQVDLDAELGEAADRPLPRSRRRGWWRRGRLSRLGKGRRVFTPLHFQSTTHQGACRKTRVMPHNSQPRPESAGTGGHENACAVVDI